MTKFKCTNCGYEEDVPPASFDKNIPFHGWLCEKCRKGRMKRVSGRDDDP